MNVPTKIAIAALGLAMTLAGASGAAAESSWQAHHPRRVEINHRLARQNHRTTHEVRDGQISRGRALALRSEDHGIRTQERFDATHRGSHLTRAESQRLNGKENRVSRQIGR